MNFPEEVVGSAGISTVSLGLRIVDTVVEAHDAMALYVLLDWITAPALAKRLRIGGRQAAIRYIVGSRTVRID